MSLRLGGRVIRGLASLGVLYLAYHYDQGGWWPVALVFACLGVGLAVVQDD